jgi:hypothetical protein
MTSRKVARIIQYNAAHEIGLVRCTDDSYWVVEGPITSDGPYRWVSEDCMYEGAKQKFNRELARPL